MKIYLRQFALAFEFEENYENQCKIYPKCVIKRSHFEALLGDYSIGERPLTKLPKKHPTTINVQNLRPRADFMYAYVF